ncbi:MAG: protein kinase, partial [Planctomycetes bacterium]|nr:protein kinase [Planctomycetota bacterium]
MEQDVLAPRIEGYRVQEMLGRGGMGAVWRATDIATERDVALKVLGLHTLGSRRARLRFEREVSLASRLEHPGIARVYGSGIGAGAHFYVMELIDGRPLDQYVRAEGLGESAVIELFLGVIDAVGHAHRRGVIHRDLKPSNILVDGEARPHILDFGLATAEDVEGVTVSRDGSPLGTLAYMAPEQARGQLDRIDLTSDLYSIGLMLCECLTGELPYEPWATRLELENRVSGHELRRPRAVAAKTGRAISRDLEAILERCLAEQPERRYAAAEALAADLRAYLQGEPVSARPLTLTYVMSRRLRRHWKPVAAAAAALTLLLGTAVVSYVQVQQQRDRAIANERQANAERLRAERTLYFNQIAHAQSLIDAGRHRQAVTALEACDPSYRRAEWAYLRQQADASVWTHSFDTAVEAYALNPAGELLAVDQQGWLHRITGTERSASAPVRMPVQRVIHASFAGDGRRVVMSDFKRWAVWDTAGNEVVGAGAVPDTSISHSLDHRGQAVMLGGSPANPQPTYRVNLADGTKREHLPATEQMRVPFAAGTYDGMLEKNPNRLLLFDPTGRTTHRISLPGTPTSAVAAQDERLVVGLESGQAVLITLGTPQSPTIISTHQLFADDRPVRSLTLHRGWAFAGNDDGRVVAQPLADRRATVTFPGLEQRVIWVAVMDERWLLAATADTVKAWDLAGSAWALNDALDVGRGSKSSFTLFDEDRSIAAADYTGHIRAVRLADAEPRWTTHVASITPLRLQADDAHGRLLISGGMGWAVLEAATGRVLHREVTRRRTDVVCLDTGALLVAAKGADARVHAFTESPIGRDDNKTIAIRRPLVRVDGRAVGQPLIIGTSPEATDRLLAYAAGGATPPRDLGRVDHPIDDLSRPS